MINSISRLLTNSIVCVTFFFVCTSLYSQNSEYHAETLFNDVNQPKPSSLLYSKLNYDNIDLSTGRVAPSIAIDVLKCNGISDEISLQYTGGAGIKVGQIASDIGLGWELQAGGYIKRHIRGFADDAILSTEYDRWIFPWEYSQFNGQKMINGWLDYADWGVAYKSPGELDRDRRAPLSDRILATAVQEFASKLYKSTSRFTKGFRKMQYAEGQDLPYDSTPLYDLNTSSATYHYDTDKESDLYEFKCGGYSGKFVINGLGQCILIPENPDIIGVYPPSSFGGGSHFNKDHWLIIAADGRQFVFPDRNGYSESSRNVTNLHPVGDLMNTPHAVESVHWRSNITKWNLKEVFVGREHKNRKSILKYYYEDVPVEEYMLSSHVGIVFHTPTEYEENGRSKVPMGVSPQGFTDEEYKNSIKRHTIFYNSKKRLKRISAAPCGYQMYFNYEDTDRIDLKTPRKALSSIVLQDYRGTVISNYELKHYFTGLGSGSYSGKRLMLKELKKERESPYKFEYNGFELPELDSELQDHWGYYHGYSAESSLPELSTTDGYDRFLEGANRSPVNTYHTQASILKKITYPTKGAVYYDYEPNEYHNFTHSTYAGTNQLTGGVRIKKIARNTRDGNIELKMYSYTLPSDDKKSSGQIPPHLEKWNKNGAGRLFDKMEVKKTWDGIYFMYLARQKFPKYLQTNDLIRYSHVTINYPNDHGKKVVQMTAFDTHPDQEKKRYAWVHDLRGNKDRFIPYPRHLYPYKESIDESRISSPTVNLGDRSYFRGLVLSDKEIDKDGNTVSELINEYDFAPNGYTAEKVYGIGGVDPQNFFIERVHTLKTYTFLFDIYEESSDFFHIKKRKKRTYTPLGGYVENVTEYIYNSADMLPEKVKELKSDGSFYVTNYRYPEVISNEGEKKLVIDFRRNKPVQVTKSLMSPSGVSKVISDQFLKYRKWSDNVTEVEKIISAKGEKINPRSGSTPGSVEFSESLVIKRDLENGNVLEYREKDNFKRVVNIWGYNEQYLIAKIEGDVTYAAIEGYVSNLKTLSYLDNDQCISDTCKEGKLRKALNELREKPEIKNKALVTTYTYNPLVGVTSITDAARVTMYYHYDSNNRLKYVKNLAGDVVSRHDYNYAKQ